MYNSMNEMRVVLVLFRYLFFFFCIINATQTQCQKTSLTRFFEMKMRSYVLLYFAKQIELIQIQLHTPIHT